MKNILLVVAFLLCALKVDAQNFEYFLKNSLGIKFEPIEIEKPNDLEYIKDTSNNLDGYFVRETPFYYFQTYHYMGLNTQDDMTEILDELIIFANKMGSKQSVETLKLKTISNDFDQTILYFQEKISNTTNSDESTEGINYFGLLVDTKNKYDEFFVFNLEVYPLYTINIEENCKIPNSVISPKFTGLDMLQSMHMTKDASSR